MKKFILGAALLSFAAATPALTQPAGYGPQGAAGWDREAFWQGAPQDPRARIDFLQQRIQSGMQDGSLSPREAQHAQYTLSGIRRDAYRSRYSRDPAWHDNIQARLDNLSQQLHWARHNGQYGNNPGGYNNGGYGRQNQGYARPHGDRDPYATSYDASRDYRDNPSYAEHRLGPDDQVYRGSDGRYYCKRSDGTTGLVIGAVGGAVVGNAIEGGHDRAAGTLIGGALGALVGKSIDQNSSDVRCR